MKQAKQQSQDLRQTDEFLTAIMKPGYVEKEKVTKPSLESSAHRQMNGRPKVPRVDSFSRFSDPPAPPPQQPLPEKPDAPPRSGSDSFPPLKRSDSDKPKSVSASSPVSRDSSQILNLIEALSTAKREIDTQGLHIKELKDLLDQERTARETAEERVKTLEAHPALNVDNAIAEGDLDKSLENESTIKLEDGLLEESAEQPNGLVVLPDVSSAPDAGQSEASTEINTTELQRRLDTMMEEMEHMRKQVASFKDRAEKAEHESIHSRQSLAEMIETVRRERAEQNATATTPQPKSEPQKHDLGKTSPMPLTSVENGTAETKSGETLVRFDPAKSKSKELDAATTAIAAQWNRRNFLEEASPYASMFGVVLLGVGLMAYLNGWQKLDK